MAESIVKRALLGGAAGAVATGAMTVPMAWMRGTDRIDEMAPERITDAALGMVDDDPTTEEHVVATSVAHLLFGVGAGALYGLLSRRGRRRWWSGSAYGLAVAAASYQGWVPATGVLPPLTRAPSGRRREVLVSHLVYGTVLAVVTSRLSAGLRTDGRGGEAS